MICLFWCFRLSQLTEAWREVMWYTYVHVYMCQPWQMCLSCLLCCFGLRLTSSLRVCVSSFSVPLRASRGRLCKVRSFERLHQDGGWSHNSSHLHVNESPVWSLTWRPSLISFLQHTPNIHDLVWLDVSRQWLCDVSQSEIQQNTFYNRFKHVNNKCVT